jgi:polyisoprenoid-binding protein YceI
MTATTAVRVELPAQGRYRIDPARSVVGYSGKHLFGLGTVHATFAIREGDLQVAETADASTASVTIDAASFASGNARRDRDVAAGGLLDVVRHPDIRFRSTGLRQADDGWHLAGTVTAHGQTVPVELTVDRVEPDGEGTVRLHARAEHLDRYAFGVTGSRGMVGRYLDLDLAVVAVQA